MRKDMKITKVYRFEELSDEAKEKAIEKLCDINVDFEWWDCVYEDAKNIGVIIKEFDLDRSSYCRGHFREDEWDVAEKILTEHGKDCETYKDAYEFLWDLASEEDTYYKKIRSQIEEDEYNREEAEDDFDAEYECPDLLEDFRQTIFEDYRIILQKEYDYQTSEKAIQDTIEANEYEFTEDGEIYN